MRSLIRSWLQAPDDEGGENQRALRDLLDALDRQEPERAKYLARFAYLLGRIAHADQHISPEETQVMEQLLEREGGLPREQAMLVVGLAKTSNLLFGGTDNFLVAREFADAATHEQKLSLVRCLFAVSAVEGNISIAEEREVQRIARELRVEHADVVKLRLEYRHQLPCLTNRANDESSMS